MCKSVLLGRGGGGDGGHVAQSERYQQHHRERSRHPRRHGRSRQGELTVIPSYLMEEAPCCTLGDEVLPYFLIYEVNQRFYNEIQKIFSVWHNIVMSPIRSMTLLCPLHGPCLSSGRSGECE